MLSMAQIILSAVFLASPDNTGKTSEPTPSVCRRPEWIFTFFLASYSFEGSRNQARFNLCLLVRFKHQTRIGLHDTIADVRFLRFHHHCCFRLQISAAFLDKEVQVYGYHWDGRPGRNDLFCGDFHLASHFDDIYIPREGTSHHDPVWDI